MLNCNERTGKEKVQVKRDAALSRGRVLALKVLEDILKGVLGERVTLVLECFQEFHSYF